MRVMHVISSLHGMGGAEVMLQRLLEASDRRQVSHEVVSLTQLGVIGGRIHQLGIPTHALNMSRVPDPIPVARLARLVAKFRPDVVQTWMYHADLFGGLAAKLAGNAKIVWGIHNNDLAPQAHRTTRWIVALCARLSHRVPDRIVCVSRASMARHVALGYAREKFVVLPNGFDLRQFRPDEACRREVRAALGVRPEEVVIGLIARTHPQKDHPTFLRAAKALAGRHAHVRFLLCGEGATPANPELARAVADSGLSDRVLLLGRREDVPRIMNALDVGTLSSTSEAFPVAVGEMMASGVPCVVTDVGDCALLVGETGLVAPPRDPAALARAWEVLVLEEGEARRRRGLAARARIATDFSLARIAREYGKVYAQALEDTAAGQVA